MVAASLILIEMSRVAAADSKILTLAASQIRLHGIGLNRS